MLVKTKKVYYCEHCGRHRLTPQSIRGHEPSCTANPNRICKMGCENGIDLPAVVAEFKARFEIIREKDWDHGFEIATERIKWHGGPIQIDEVLAITEGCPACTLAVIRQAGLNRVFFAGERWDYRKAQREWWAERNAECEYLGY